MSNQTRLGMITPSLNTVLEPVTYALLADLPDVTAHFSRVQVTRVSLGEDSAAQFAHEPMLAAARMLADARVHAICWNGTAGSWLGPDFDRRLCEAIARETGIPATSATLALAELFRSRGVKRYALVTPFEGALQEAIIETYGREGFECVAERHVDSDDTFGYASIPPATTEGMIRDVVSAEPEAIAAVCTNLNGAPHAPALEAEAGVPVYDSVAAALWGTLALAGADPSRINGWGEIFSVAPASLERLGALP
ncbi:MAG: aspartate/glutamate racemase family protein [Rhodospirillaceae bacterium]|nr:aspartate/glutamate racemase family protein [Rhodospirillaceae bacterium]